MLKHRIIGLCVALLPCHIAAEPLSLSFKVSDSQTDNPVEDARVIVNQGPSAEPENAEMGQKNRQFQPRSLVVPRGSTVNFPNYDNTQHHVYSFSPAKTFNIELFANQPDKPILFDETGVIEVGCNIHDQMQGFILVTDSTLTAQTDESGLAEIAIPEELASKGNLSLSLWHPRLKNTTETMDFKVGLPSAEPIELTLELTPAREESGRLDGLQKRFRDL